MNWRELVLPHLRAFEGYRSEAYQDSAGVWTIGYGATAGVRPGLVTTRAEAEERLLRDLDAHAAPAFAYVKVPLSEHEKAAIASFAYNVGVGAFGRSTLLRKLNAGDRQGAADEFLRWNKAGGRTLRGLSRRRRAERKMFLTPDRKETPWQRFMLAVLPPFIWRT